MADLPRKKFVELGQIVIKPNKRIDPIAVDHDTGEYVYSATVWLRMMHDAVNGIIRESKQRGVIGETSDIFVENIGGQSWLMAETSKYEDLTREQLIERLEELEHRMESLDK